MTSWQPTEGAANRYRRPALLTGLVGFLLLACWPVEHIELHMANNLCRMPDRGFALQWQHSVEKEDWREEYVRQGRKLLLTRSQFKTYGAGTPNTGQLQDQGLGLIGYQVNRSLERLSWTVSGNVRSTLWLDNMAWPVHAWLDDYEELDFQVRRLPLWRFLLVDSCHDLFRKTDGRSRQ